MKEKAEDYVVVMDGSWIDGRPRKAGDKVAMTPAAAKYLLLSGAIEQPPAARKPALQGAAPATVPPTSAKKPAAAKAPAEKEV